MWLVFSEPGTTRLNPPSGLVLHEKLGADLDTKKFHRGTQVLLVQGLWGASPYSAPEGALRILVGMHRFHRLFSPAECFPQNNRCHFSWT